jgi:rhodanese-related sulfurtransferase
MGLKTISPEDVHRLLGEGEAFAIDVNAPMSWARARVPGAVNLDPVAFDTRDLPADKGTPLVFYCSNSWCRKAPNAARRAISLGYENVRVMAAGIQGWMQKNLPVESGLTRTPPRAPAPV